jgi:hypothetical protein
MSSDTSDNGDFLDADHAGDTSEDTSSIAGTPISGVSTHLSSYQTKEYRRLLDIIDAVRKYDINHVLPPQGRVLFLKPLVTLSFHEETMFVLDM